MRGWVVADSQNGSVRQPSGQATYLAEFAHNKLHFVLVQTEGNNSTNLANLVQAQDKNLANLANQGTPREVLTDPQDGSLEAAHPLGHMTELAQKHCV